MTGYGEETFDRRPADENVRKADGDWKGADEDTSRQTLGVLVPGEAVAQVEDPGGESGCSPCSVRMKVGEEIPEQIPGSLLTRERWRGIDYLHEYASG